MVFKSGVRRGIVPCLVTACLAASAVGEGDRRDDGDQEISCLRQAPVILGYLSPDELPEHPALVSPDGWAQRGGARSWEGEIYNSQPVEGTYRIPAIAFGFNNVVVPEGIEAELLSSLGADPPTVSLRSYYLEMSNGVFEIIPEVHIVEALPQDDEYYENGDRGWGSESRRRLLNDLIPLLDGEVDFGRYDNDGPDGVPNSGDDDGRVDAIMLFTPESRGAGLDNIYPHAWDARSSFPPDGLATNDEAAGGGPILIGVGCTQSGLNSFGQTDVSVGVCAHEMGHCLGLPDLYDVEKQYSVNDDDPWSGVGMFCLMGSASFSNLSAWCKLKLGWVEAVQLNGLDSQLIEIPAVNNARQVFRIDLRSNGSEYFLMEYRLNQAPFEAINGQGVAIYHIDERKRNNYHPNCSGIGPVHSLVHVEEADGSCNLENSQSASLTSWWGWEGAGDKFSAETTPHSLRWDGLDTGVEIRDFSPAWPPPPEGFMTAVVTAPEAPQDDLLPDGLEIVWAFDISGSYADDLIFMRDQVLDAINEIEAWYPRSRHAMVAFADFPFPPWGASIDIPYVVLQNFAENPNLVRTFVAGLQTLSGGDFPECQYEVLHQILTGEGRDWNEDGQHSTGDIAPFVFDWTPTRTAAIILMTDAHSHDGNVEEDYPVPGPTQAAGELTVLNDLMAAPGTVVGKTPHVYILDAVDDGIPSFDDEGFPAYEPTVLQVQAETLAQWSNGAYIAAGENTSRFHHAVREAVYLLSLADPMGGSCVFTGSSGGPLCEDDYTRVQCQDIDGIFMPFSTGCEQDCDNDGNPDLVEIVDALQWGVDLDVNDNGVLDECECLGDLDEDNDVDIDDLLYLIGYWGTCEGSSECSSDIDDNWTVDVEDLLLLLSRWGSCVECLEGEVPDCNGNCAPETWIGDGVCDDGLWDYNGVFIFFNCDEFDNDGGDCDP